MDDYSVQRRRQAEARDAIDRLDDPSPPPGARYKGRVYNGGAMPTAVPRVYLTHPVETMGRESEGEVPTDAVGEGSVPVLVTGHVPAVGDDLIARKIGGLWVARIGRAGGVPCGDCPIPRKTLHLNWTVFRNPAPTSFLTAPGEPTVLEAADGDLEFVSDGTFRYGSYLPTNNPIAIHTFTGPYWWSPSISFKQWVLTLGLGGFHWTVAATRQVEVYFACMFMVSKFIDPATADYVPGRCISGYECWAPGCLTPSPFAARAETYGPQFAGLFNSVLIHE